MTPQIAAFTLRAEILAQKRRTLTQMNASLNLIGTPNISVEKHYPCGTSSINQHELRLERICFVELMCKFS